MVFFRFFLIGGQGRKKKGKTGVNCNGKKDA